MEPEGRTGAGRRSGKVLAALAFLGALAVLAWQVHWLWPYVSDDAFISMRYAQRLAEGHGLTWNDGERVEGYSNLLWTLATALGMRLGLEGLLTVRLLGGICAGGALFVLAFGTRPRCLADGPACFGATLMVAACPPLAVWTTGGLEGPMVLLFGCTGLVLLLPALEGERVGRARLALAGVPFGLLCLARPDAPLWVGSTALVAGFVWFLDCGISRAASRLSAVLFAPFLAIAGQLWFRLSYYGDLWPNTAYVKVGISRHSIEAGAAYLAGAGAAHAGLLLFALLEMLLLLRASGWRIVAVLALPVLLFAGYLLLIGGDHFPGWRMAFPMLAPLALLGANGLRSMARAGLLRSALAWILALLLPTLQIWITRRDPRTRAAGEETWEWDGKAQAECLGRAFASRRPLLAVDGAGVLPYYSRLPCLDMLGLNDREIARTAPPRLEVFTPGHVRGNGPYVLARQPDIVQFGHPPGIWRPPFLSGAWLEASAEFREAYRCVRLEVPTPMPSDGAVRPVTGWLWFRVMGRAGIAFEPGRVVIPGHMLAGLRLGVSMQNLPAHLDPEDPRHAALLAAGAWLRSAIVAVPDGEGLALELRGRDPARFEGFPLAAGRWVLRCEPAGARARLLDAPIASEGQIWRGGSAALEVGLPEGVSPPLRVRRVILEAR
ncbi:MAG: hypothetical protein Fur0037_03450 [Planctomycetota bacterium]